MSRRGLTLVEVLVALAIIGIVAVVLANSQILNLRVTRDSQQASLATQVGSRAIEVATGVVLADFDQLSDCDGAREGCTGTTGELVGAYRASYAIFGPTSEETRGLIRIDVTVQEPAPLTMSHYVSCMDVRPNPTVVEPAPCRWSP